MKKIIFSLLVLLLVTGQWSVVSVFAGNDSTNALPYLRMGIGARPLGMGGAFTAVADDANASYWNPAGLGQIEKKEIKSMYAILSEERSLNFLNYVHPLWHGTPGISIISAGVKDIKGYDQGGNFTKDFDYSSYVLLLSYGRKVEDVSVGGNLKIISDKLNENSAFGFGFDLGLLFKPSDSLSIGLVMQDIYTQLQWDTDSKAKDILPISIKTGAAYMFLERKLLLAADINKVVDRKRLKYNIGSEYHVAESLSVRAGVNNGKIAVGFSFKYMMVQLDYAFAPYGELGDDFHRISLGASFR